MLKELRNEYISEFPEKIQQVETLILAVAENRNIDDFNELFRVIHSQKGTAGTHGFHIITSVCHYFENELSRVAAKIDDLESKEVQQWLVYVDLLTEAHNSISDGDTGYELIEEKLHDIQYKQDGKEYTCLLVDTRSSTLSLIEEILKKHSIHSIIIDDGYEALGRLLVEKFDMLICGLKISTLSGTGVIAAVKSSDSVNSNIPSILITSTDYSVSSTNVEPDYVIKKDIKLPVLLNDICQDIITELHKY